MLLVCSLTTESFLVIGFVSFRFRNILFSLLDCKYFADRCYVFNRNAFCNSKESISLTPSRPAGMLGVMTTEKHVISMDLGTYKIEGWIK